MYAPRADIGRTITCVNCLDEFLVEQPPEPSDPGHGPENASASHDNARSPDEETALVGGETRLKPREPTDGGSADDDRSAADADYEFDVECPLCGTRQDAVRAQVGGKVRCPDCFFLITIREPSRRQRRQRGAPRPEADELHLSEPADAQPLRSLAHEYMDAAAREAPAEESRRVSPPSTAAEALRRADGDVAARRPPPLPHRPLTNGALRFLADPRALIRCIAVGIGLQLEVAAILAAIRLFHGGPFEQFLCALSLAFCFAFGGVVLLVTSVTFLAVLQDTAIGRDKIESWPEGFFVDWLFEGFYVVAALFVAMLPGVLAGQVALCVGATTTPYSAAVLACCGLTGFFLFPILLLSSLEAGSPWNVNSPRIRRSLSLLPRGWGRFYLLAGALFLAAAPAALLRRLESFPVNVAAMIWVAVLAMVYFRLLGRLAWCCREAVAVAETDEQTEAPTAGGTAD